MRLQSPASRTACCFMMAASMIGCGGSNAGGPQAPAQTATLSGTVRQADSQSPIAGATVTVGTASTTTAANGRFELQNVAVGTVNVIVNANRFDPEAKTITLTTGVNTVDIFLAPQTFYLYDQGEVVAFLPPGVSTFRGVIYFLHGFGADSRPIVRGEATAPGCVGWCDPLRAELRQGSVQLAERYGLALIGTNDKPNDPGTYNVMLSALASFAAQSGHPELAQAPLLLLGASAGGCLAYGFTRVHSARVIGFMTVKGGCHIPTDAGVGARSVPAYFFIGEEDLPNRAVNITTVFEHNRALGALWAVAIELGTTHTWPQDLGLQIHWMEAVLAQRLPVSVTPDTPVTLNPITEASGWLGNRSTYAIAGWGCYSGDKLVASWLPTEQTARDWQGFVAGAGGVNSCVRLQAGR